MTHPAMKQKTKWVKETPKAEGWYWMKYKGGRGQTVTCPAQVSIVGETTIVTSARNDSFIEGPNHGGPGLKYGNKIDKSIRFAHRIEDPQ